MMSPNGTSVGGRGAWKRRSRPPAAGSGYGTSSGANRTISARSHTISPPARRVSTSDSPSARWSRIDRLPPLAKYASSARGRTPGRDGQIATNAATDRAIFTRPLDLSPEPSGRFDDGRVKHADTQLARILRGRRQLARHERLIDLDANVYVLVRAERGRRQCNLAQQRRFLGVSVNWSSILAPMLTVTCCGSSKMPPGLSSSR